MRIQEFITESTSLKTTITAISNDIGEPVASLYATMKSMAKKYVERRGNLFGFGFISGAAGARWFQTFYVNKLQSELYDLIKFNPHFSGPLKSFLRGHIVKKDKNSKPELLPFHKFSQISNILPEILVEIGTKLNSPQLINSANTWIKNRKDFATFLINIESEPDTVTTPAPNATPATPSVTGQQQQQVDKIVNDILKSLPSNVAGDIRNAIARSPNKLMALQQELKDRNITP